MKQPINPDEPLHTRLAVGHRITALRKNKNLSQAGLSEKTGYAQPYLSRIEKGQASPPVDTLLDICEALDCELQIRPRTTVIHTADDE